MNDFEVPPCACPECGYVGDQVMGVSTEHKPVPGDLSLCIHCACLSAFDDDLKLRPPTDDELFAAATDRRVQAARAAILHVNAEHKKHTLTESH
jgi:hypothetical protein